MVIKPIRKNKTETPISGTNYLGVAENNRVPLEKATNIIDSLIQNKILKDKKTEDLRVNLKVQDETALAATRVQKLVDEFKNNPNAAFLTEQELHNTFNKHAASEFKLLRNLQKTDPGAARYLFSNIHTVLNNGRKDFFKVKDTFLGVKANQAVTNSPTYIKNELSKYSGQAKVSVLENLILGENGHLANMQGYAINYKIDKFNLEEAKTNATLETFEQLLIEDARDKITGRINYDNILKTLKNPKETIISGLEYGNLLSENPIAKAGQKNPSQKAKSYRNTLITRMTELKTKQIAEEKIFFGTQNDKKIAEGDELLRNALNNPNFFEDIQKLKVFFYQEGNVDGPSKYKQLEVTAKNILKDGTNDLTEFGALVITNNLIENAGKPGGLNSRFQKYILPGYDIDDKKTKKIDESKVGYSILERLGMEGPSGINMTDYERFEEKLKGTPVGVANIRFDKEVSDHESLFIGSNLGGLIDEAVINRIMSVKSAQLRKIFNQKLSEGITEDELFSPGNPNYIFNARGLMLPFVATEEDTDKYKDISFGEEQLSDEEKKQLLKDQSSDGSIIIDSNNYIDEEKIDEENLNKAIKFLRENPKSIERFILIIGEDNVPDDLKYLINKGQE
tara:strand:- start:3202 stop:5070 length:1869 start_codon:yes stop_codon:yes gene_type:complete